MIKTMIFCDRCGRLINTRYGALDNRLSHIKLLDYSKSSDYSTIILCDSCMRGLYNFMEKRVLSYDDISKEDF